MTIKIRGARENNLQGVEAEFGAGLTVVTGVSGSGKSSLVFDTLYQEARRRYQEVITLGASRERVPPAAVDSISGLLPAVAVGQNLLNRNPNSTVASASGLHPLLRLLYARFGRRRCAECGAPVQTFDEDSLIAYLQSNQKNLTVSVSLVRQAKGSHTTLLKLLGDNFGPARLLVDGKPYQQAPLSPDQSHTITLMLAVLSGGETVSELRKIVQKAGALGSSLVTLSTPDREETLSLAPVCASCGAWLSPLEPKDFHQPCPNCKGEGCQSCLGTGITPAAAATDWQGLRLDQFLAQPVAAVTTGFDAGALPPQAGRLAAEIITRLEALQQVGLGYVSLDRPVPTLSRGEAQRLRLAVLLTGRLADLLHLLDEPTIGLHPHDVEPLMAALANLSGPVIYVEHDRIAAARANAALDIGPGAGRAGGRVTFSGTPSELWQTDTATGAFFSGRESCLLPKKRPAPTGFLTVQGADCHNLAQIDVPLALGRLNVICGVSGSGKSTLVEEVLFASLKSGEPVGCTSLDAPKIRPVLVDQSPIGRNPRSNPATYTKLLDSIRDCFAANTGLDATCFSFNTGEGACPVCGGMGAVEIKMRYLPSTWITCDACEGARFTDEVLAAKVTFADGLARSIADVLDLTVSDALPLMTEAPGLSERARENAIGLLQALADIGLGYLTLGQPSPTLSGGEAQRVKLAKYLGRARLQGRLLLLDEPTTGLHPADIHGLLVVLDRLVRVGATVVVVEHNTDIIRAADWLVELGPGAGPEGGRLLFAGPAVALGKADVTPTSRALAEEADLQVRPVRPTDAQAKPDTIRVCGARANNLQGVDVEIPKGALTVVTGLSGSGKSSLVVDVIEREAQRRYFESLAMYERQSVKESREADVDAVEGLGVTLSVGTRRAGYNQRAHLGDDTEIGPALAVLFARSAELDCPICGEPLARQGQALICHACGNRLPQPRPRHFSPTTYAAACQTCHGVGTLQEPRPEKLIIHPEKPLCGGAMYSPGFFPKGYLCKPFNGGYDMVQAFAARHGFDPATTPWNEIAPEVWQYFLFGDPEPLPVTYTSRKGVVTERTHHFPGFYGWIRDWDQGGTYTETVSCPDCRGTGLREPFRSARLAGETIHALCQLHLAGLQAFIQALPDAVTEDPLNAKMLVKIRGRLGSFVRSAWVT